MALWNSHLAVLEELPQWKLEVVKNVNSGNEKKKNQSPRLVMVVHLEFAVLVMVEATVRIRKTLLNNQISARLGRVILVLQVFVQMNLEAPETDVNMTCDTVDSGFLGYLLEWMDPELCSFYYGA